MACQPSVPVTKSCQKTIMTKIRKTQTISSERFSLDTGGARQW
jgi:hypothetical protein